MAGTRTAPAATAAATNKTVSMRFIDASGDLISHSLLVPSATTAADIETMVADIAERTNASLYAIEITENRVGARAASNATTDPRTQSVFDHIVMLFKNAVTGKSQEVYIPANLEATMLDPTTDTPNLADLSDLGTSALVVLGAGYAFIQARYTERREISSAVRP